MDGHHSYKQRDFDFAHLLVTLRRRAHLTQGDVALRIGISEKSIRNWEGGSNYPSELNLRKLIEIYLDRNVFTARHELDEARLLWAQLHERVPLRVGVFDEQWFAALLQERQACSISQAQPSTGSQQSMQLWSVRTHPSAPFSSPETEHQASSPHLLYGEWSEVLDVSALCGRTEELAELERWLLVDQCRLVAMLGMGGIGKTALAVKLMQQMIPHFDGVLWRSLQNAPPLEELLRDWLPAISGQHSTYIPQEIDQSLAFLIKLLQERRWLLVLDNMETLFQEGALEGRYRQGYEPYAMLIRHVAESMHQSCLLLTCREKFPDLGVFTGRQAPVRMFRLGGLPLPASQQMLQEKGLFGDQQAWSELVQRYAGNPLALKVVAEMVHELFGGDIAAFLTEGVITFYGIDQLLAQQFERLSILEQTLLYWLAIERELIPLEALQKDLLQRVSKRDLVEAMYSLHCRSLVERGERGASFMLQPVVLAYVTERLVALASDEIRDSRPALLLTHPLLQGQAKDYLRVSQARFILQPVLDKLLSHFGTSQHLEVQLDCLLQQLRAVPRTIQGYGGGNMVNLLICLNGHIRGKDCSYLTIWQADLQEAEAQDAVFVESDLVGSAFMETMDSILSVALSANGQYIASGSNTGDIRVWQVVDGQLLLAIQGHIGLVWSLAFHPESTLLVSGGYDGLVKLWEVSSGACVGTLQGHTKWVHTLAFHPAGKLLVTGSQDGSVRLWDPMDSRCIKVWHEQASEILSVAFSPGGQLLASGDVNGVVKLWDLTSERCLWTITAHHGASASRLHGVTSIAFSPDGELLVSGGEDATIMVWEASSGKHLNTLSGHTDMVRSISFNAEGLLASGSFDCTVKLWKIGYRGEDVRCLDTLPGHTKWVWSTVFGPGGLLVSGGHDGVVKLWQISRGGKESKCLRTMCGYSRQINAVSFSPDGRILVSGEHNGTVRTWETMSGQCLRISSRQADEPLTIVYSPDGQLFATSVPDKTIKIWEAGSGRCLRTLKGHQGEIWSVAFSPDGRFLVSGSVDTTVKRWEASSGRCLATFQGHRNWVWSVICSPDGTLLASGDVDGIVKLWQIDSGQCLHTLHGSPKAILALAFTSDGTMLLGSDEQNLVTVWDVKSGLCLKTVPGNGDSYWLGSVTFSADGSLLAAASSDQTVKIWDVSSGELLHTFPCYTGRPGPVAFSADQRLLACGTDEGTIMLWERQTGKCLMTLQSERPYERMNISSVTGITEAQKVSLKTLGAIEEPHRNHEGNRFARP